MGRLTDEAAARLGVPGGVVRFTLTERDGHLFADDLELDGQPIGSNLSIDGIEGGIGGVMRVLDKGGGASSVSGEGPPMRRVARLGNAPGKSVAWAAAMAAAFGVGMHVPPAPRPTFLTPAAVRMARGLERDLEPWRYGDSEEHGIRCTCPGRCEVHATERQKAAAARRARRGGR